MPCCSLVLNLLIAGGCLAELLQTSTLRRHAFTITDEKLPKQTLWLKTIGCHEHRRAFIIVLPMYQRAMQLRKSITLLPFLLL